MQIWQNLCWLALVGGVGGFVAFVAPGGIRTRLRLDNGVSEASWAQRVLLGVVAAAGAFAIREPNTAMTLASSAPNAPTLGEFAAAFVTGLGGAKWFSNHVQGTVIRSVAAAAAAADANSAAGAAIAGGRYRSAAEMLGLKARPS